LRRSGAGKRRARRTFGGLSTGARDGEPEN
jgi:hypothetical protein